MIKNTLLTFTFVVEFRGGTYCSQVKAKNIGKSIIAWAEKLKSEKSEIQYLGNKTIDEIIILTQDNNYKPVPLNKLKNVWYVNYLTKQGFCSINIIQTDTN